MPATAVRTPLHHGGALKTGTKRYRKEILVKGPLHVNGDVFDVTDEYLDQVMAAFRAEAIKSPPIKAAPSSNDHTRDVFRRCGTITGLHRTARGIDADLEPDDQLDELISRYPDTGVSVLIEHNRTTGSGEHFPAALAHLLVTEDPVINNLGEWRLAASHEHNGDVLDLLALSLAATAPTETPAPPATATVASAPPERATSSDEGAPHPSEGTPAMPTLTDLLTSASEDELRALRARLDTMDPAADGVVRDDDAPAGAETVEDDDEVTDEEIADALAAADELDAEDAAATSDDGDESETDAETETADDTAEADVDTDDAELEEVGQVAASNAATIGGDLRLAQAQEQISAMQASQAKMDATHRQMQARINDADWNERQAALVAAGVPPTLIALARPALHGNDDTLALSHDARDQTAGLVQSLLLEFGQTLNRLGLSQHVRGSEFDTPADVAEADTRNQQVSSVLASTGALSGRRRS